MMKKDKTTQKIIEIILVAIIIIALINVALYFTKEKHAGNVYKKMQQESIVVEIGTEIAEKTEVTEVTEKIPYYDGMPEVDFESLWETNTDICAWIFVPGTQVNYPVLYHAAATDPYDSYYLEHTVEQTPGLPGAIYIEPCNTADFTDANTVIYGHHMKNGTMFASLDYFLDDAFMEENQYAYIVTPEKNMVYQIFAAVVYDDRHIMSNFDFENTADYQSFLDSITANSNTKDVFREDVEVSTEDRMITMSTCVKGQDDKRLLVMGVLVDEYEI